MSMYSYHYGDSASVSDYNFKGKKCIQPSYQSNVKVARPYFTKYTFNEPSSTSLQSTSKIRCTIPKNSFEKLNHWCLEIRGHISGGSGTVLAPLPFWFSRIELATPSNEILYTWYSQDLLLRNVLSFNQGQLDKRLRALNMDYRDDNVIFGVSPDSIPASAYRTYFLDLPFFWGDLCQYDFSDAPKDLVLNFYPASTLVASGSGSFVLDAMSLITHTDLVPPSLQQKMDIETKTMPYCSFYLQPQQIILGSKTINAGTSNTYLLDSLESGNYAAFFVMIQNTSATNASNGQMAWLNIGDSANPSSQMDILNASSNTMLGNPSTQYLSSTVALFHSPNDFLQKKECHILPFCHNFCKALQGKVDGMISVDSGSKFQLSLTPASSATNEVQTITLNNTNNAGYYKINYLGYSTSPLAYNASAATMKSNFEALPSASRDNVTVTFSQAVSAGTSFTATLVSPQKDHSSLKMPELITLDSQGLNSSGTMDSGGTSVLTNPPQDGFSSGTYDIIILAYKYKIATVWEGQVNISDL